MRIDDSWAWGEFGARFEPLLVAYARRIGVASEVRRERVLDLLADEGLRLAEGRDSPPVQLVAYLARALRHRYLNDKRSTARREAAYAAASMANGSNGSAALGIAGARRPRHRGEAGVGECVVEYASSEAALRNARALDAEPPPESLALIGFMASIRRQLTDQEQLILGWEERRLPHRQIAEWLGVSYDAATKRIWRLKRRLQTLAAQYCSQLPADDDRRELERLFRRSGVKADDGQGGTRTAGFGDGEDARP